MRSASTRPRPGRAPHVGLGGGKALLQHAGDLLVGQAVAGLDVDARLHAAALLAARTDAQQAVGIDGEGDADAGRTGRHGRDAAQLEARQAAAIGHQVALALHHMHAPGGLAVLVGGEVLRLGGGDGLVARHDALDQAAHGLDAQRQRDHVQQQQLARRVVAGQLVGLDGGAQRHHLVGVEVGQRLAAEKSATAADLRHAGGAAHHDHALHVVARKPGVAQHLAHGRQRARVSGAWPLEVAARHQNDTHLRPTDQRCNATTRS
jgi:hypothetical protein